MEIIKSKSNKKLSFIRELMEKPKERKRRGVFIVEGIKMVKEALELGLVEELYLSQSFYNKIEHEDFLIKTGFSLFSDELFSRISETVSPQGIMGLVKMPQYELSSVLHEDELKLLVLEGISDPGNLGTMIRTAEGAGITAVIISSDSVDLFNPKVVRSTMGSIFRLPFILTKNLTYTIKELKQMGLHFYAAHLKAEQSFQTVSYEKKSAVLIGNEARGLTDEITALCDSYIKIPMKGKVESLNASIAAALIMYEMTK